MNRLTGKYIFTMVVFLALPGCDPEAETRSYAPDAAAVVNIDYLNLDPEVEYVCDEDCALCHSEIFASFKKTGMGRSFYPLTADNLIETFPSQSRIYDKKLNSYYEAVAEGDAFYQVEYRLNERGRRVHELSRKIHYVIGSGNQARTYLTEENGRLFELPLTWY